MASKVTKVKDYPKKPILNYRTVIKNSGDPGYVNRVLVATPVTGLVRIEWVQARYGQIIPVNWSQVMMNQFMDSYMPLQYEVADAQNIIVKEAIERDFVWLILVEQDNVLPPNAFLMFNEYMREAKVPIVSGLYYTRSIPSEPLIFRGRGLSYYTDWKLGDVVHCDGVPTGVLLIHVGVLKEMWKDSPEYMAKNVLTRRIFDSPRALWYDPETGYQNSKQGTSDLEWCARVIEGDYLRKAGWGDFVDSLPDKRYQMLLDTRLFVGHIDQSGAVYPPGYQPYQSSKER